MPAKQTDSTEQQSPVFNAQAFAEIAEQSQRIVAEFIKREPNAAALGPASPIQVGAAFSELAKRLIASPYVIVEAQFSLWQDYLKLWQNTSRRMLGLEPEPVITPSRGDRRFRDAAWEENQVFDFIKQSYLVTARWLQGTITQIEGLDEVTERKIDFYTRQFVDAMAPTNFLITNPEVIRATLESQGQNLLDGLKNLLGDLERGGGQLKISSTDPNAFEVGRNLATTPGKVVYRNDLMQLIQYSPTTETVHEVPLLIVPPWINKYYILDLREKNSFIRWAVSRGLTVFVVSWVNPDARLANKSFEDYMVDGPLAALDAIAKATGCETVNAIGYCLGGTLLSATLAHMAARDDKRIASATLFATMVDFSEAGELEVFIDEDQILALEQHMERKGYLDGAAMATTFNMLRANDLIWSFVVNNYLLGRDPFPFDLLFWNSDSTRMPAAMHSFYLRKCYQENKLIEPGGITLKGTPIDLGQVTIPLFLLATREDHIAPWRSAFAATQYFKGPKRFVLAGSGHIAGVVNPPSASRYQHWEAANGKIETGDPDIWLANAKELEGSWWPSWYDWVAERSGDRIPARVPGDGALKALEDAPGSYVKVTDQN